MAEFQAPGGEGGRAAGMGDHKDRRSGIRGQGCQKRQDLFAACRIQAPCWFIGQQEGRAVDQGAGNSDPLLFSSGKFTGIGFEAVSDPEPFGQRRNPGREVFDRQAVEPPGQCNVLPCRKQGEQMERLENKTGFPSSQECPSVIVQTVHVLAAQYNLSGIPVFQTGDQMEKGTFPAAAFPPDGHKFASIQLQIDILEQPAVWRIRNPSADTPEAQCHVPLHPSPFLAR